MGRKYYLVAGHNLDEFKKCKLNRVIDEEKNSLKDIFLYTIQFDKRTNFLEELRNKGLLKFGEEVGIAYYKTDKETHEKKLVPIFRHHVINGNDVKNIGLKGPTYLDYANQLWEMIKSKQNDKDFVEFMSREYIDKYKSSKKEVKAPIYENRDLNILYNCAINPKYAEKHIREYELSFANVFLSEIFKGKFVTKEFNFNGLYQEKAMVFIPNYNEVNQKGFHDMLINSIKYKIYEFNNVIEEKIDKEVEDQKEEFLEDRDLDIMLKNFFARDDVDFDLEDAEKVMQSEYVKSILDEKEGYTKGK